MIPIVCFNIFSLFSKLKLFFQQEVRLNIGHMRPSLGVELYRAADSHLTGLYVTRILPGGPAFLEGTLR